MAETGETNYSGLSSMNTRGIVYENLQPANPTIRNETGSHEIVGHGYHNGGIVYENLQPANPTNRETDNGYSGPATSLKIYKTYGDKTRPSVVEEVLAKDYLGVKGTKTSLGESRVSLKNFIENRDNVQL